MPEDLFFPERGLDKTIIFLENSDDVGDYSRDLDLPLVLGCQSCHTNITRL